MKLKRDKKQWMTSMYDAIKGKRLSELVIPGTHDSGTFGILSDDGYLVESSFNVFYDLGLPEVHLWSRSQRDNFTIQLESGIRYLDLRIVAIPQSGSFYWWHGLTGDRIESGLQEIANFAQHNKGEILILEFYNFVRPGDRDHNTLTMNETEKTQTSDLIYKYLGPYLVPSSLAINPTVESIIATNKNILAYFGDSDVVTKHSDVFRNDIIINGWDGQTNTEGLFIDRSKKLEHFHDHQPNDTTLISGCVTPSTSNVIGGMLLAGLFPKGLQNSLTEIQLSALLETYDRTALTSLGSDLAKHMGFEGTSFDLLDLGNKTNTLGMNARDKKLFSSVGSVHFKGTRDMIRYWLARPNLYKPNIIEVDNYHTSDVVSLAILANDARIPREVSINFQGNTRDGYAKKVFDIFYTGGDEGLKCKSVLTSYDIISATKGVLVNMSRIQNHESLIIIDGQYPIDSNITLYVSSSGSKQWYEIYHGNIQDWIINNHDIYIRGSDTGNGSGFAYVSTKYNDFGPKCTEGLKAGVLNYVEWDAKPNSRGLVKCETNKF
ncbi:PI-PLC X domain-containing protein 2-like [Saccoglossus kowalevskii]